MPSGRPVLNREVSEIKARLLELYKMADQSLGVALEALRRRDAALAKSLVEGDARINEFQRELEEEGLRALATQAPVAKDLRMLVADMQIALELERIADHAADIGRLVISNGVQAPPMPLATLEAMASHARTMLGCAVEAYLNGDVDQAYALADQDDRLDDLEDEAVDEILSKMCVGPGTKVRGTHLLWMVHKLERVGDRSTNIAERVIFIEHGETIDLNMRPVRTPPRPR